MDVLKSAASRVSIVGGAAAPAGLRLVHNQLHLVPEALLDGPLPVADGRLILLVYSAPFCDWQLV